MRLVTAFGQEAKEIKNYSKYLKFARDAGIKTQIKTAITLGFFMLTMFGSYALTFYIGGVWITKEIPNHTTGMPYTSGDILACLFGVIFGMASLGQASPNIKAISEGKAAAKMIFDVIDRVPTIDS